jgi:hypothetical protein
MKNNLIDILLATLLVILLVLLTDPFMLFMPSMMAMTVLFIVVVFLGVWIGFVVKEKASDEREALHRMHSGRIAYLSGLTLLTIALIVQGFAHHVDPWVAGALGVMVVSKLIARLYFEQNH